jgi:hypothetical protein
MAVLLEFQREQNIICGDYNQGINRATLQTRVPIPLARSPELAEYSAGGKEYVSFN